MTASALDRAVLDIFAKAGSGVARQPPKGCYMLPRTTEQKQLQATLADLVARGLLVADVGKEPGAFGSLTLTEAGYAELTEAST